MIAIPSNTEAQSDLKLWFKPSMGDLKPIPFYEAGYFAEESIRHQAADMEFTRHNAGLIYPAWQNAENEWTLNTSIDYIDFDTRAIFPDSGRRFPDDLTSLQFGTTYRRLFDNDWIGGGNLQFGSASDELFDSGDEMETRATGFLRIPSADDNAWLLFLHYSNNREYLNNIPLPGAGYYFQPTEYCRAAVGIPFLFLDASPFEELRIEMNYFALRKVHAQVTYEMMKPVSLYTRFDWDNDRFFLADRLDDDDRLFFYEKRIGGGVKIELARNVYLDLSGGFAFDRFFFEGEDYDDRNDNRIELDDGPFAAIRIGVDF